MVNNRGDDIIEFIEGNRKNRCDRKWREGILFYPFYKIYNIYSIFYKKDAWRFSK